MSPTIFTTRDRITSKQREPECWTSGVESKKFERSPTFSDFLAEFERLSEEMLFNGSVRIWMACSARFWKTSHQLRRTTGGENPNFSYGDTRWCAPVRQWDFAKRYLRFHSETEVHLTTVSWNLVQSPSAKPAVPRKYTRIFFTSYILRYTAKNVFIGFCVAENTRIRLPKLSTIFW
jgi:hypothetical protein